MPNKLQLANKRRCVGVRSPNAVKYELYGTNNICVLMEVKTGRDASLPET